MPDQDALISYIPEQIYPYVKQLWDHYGFHLKISRPRRTKLGDYRPPQNGHTHRISVNGDLNNYAFLITLIHEVAHLKTYEEHKFKVKPHGLEWKENYKMLMHKPLNAEVFPDDVNKELLRYMANPKASSCVDQKLYKTVRRYDKESGLKDTRLVLIEELNEGDRFMMPSGRGFILSKKLRTRYKCTDIHNGKTYTISAIAEVYPL